MKSKEVIQEFEDTVNKVDSGLMQKIQVMTADSQMKIHDIHARTTACHCECLGLSAENMLAAIANQQPRYGQEYYLELMFKWGLIDKKGNPTI